MDLRGPSDPTDPNGPSDPSLFSSTQQLHHYAPTPWPNRKI